ncbi:amidase [Tricholoma matsutake]|nr:amidase [Tricholoma matsutake 945]
MWPFSSSYLTVVNSKRAERTHALTSASPSLETNQFLKATATEIVSRIEKGEWTATQVIEAYIARAAFAQTVTNCLTEVMFDWAREQARDLDNEFASTQRLRGPLHGVPTSFKDQFDVVGFDSCLGFTRWAHNPATANADLVAHFLAAGAVLFVKTNIPQTLFTFECSNPVWGRTTHPYNDKYTCGGSSGGEAALLAMDGSAVGLGSDVGGSLRIPTAYCGIYSLKPGHGRISSAGARGTVPGFEGIKNVVGPMGRSIKDLELVAKSVLGLQGSDPSIAPLPYREPKLPSKLRFGYYTSDGYVKSSPACARAVLETVEALRKEGHECVEFDVPGAEAFYIFLGLTSSDGYKKMTSHIGPDPMERNLLLATISARVFSGIRTMAAWVLETYFGDKIFADSARSARVKTVGKYTELIAERNGFIRSFHEQVWDKCNFDGIIAPVQAVPQLPHGGCNGFAPLAVATILYNVLDLPVGVLPVTRVDPAKDQLTEEWTRGPGHGSRILEHGVYWSNTPIYNPEATKGMPVGIQLVGKKWEDEKVLAMMHVVEEALGKDRGFGLRTYTQPFHSSLNILLLCRPARSPVLLPLL